MISRRVAAVLFAVVLAGCGESEPRWKEKTSAEWAARLWSADPKEAAEAHDALLALSERRPEPVLAAVEAAMRRPLPPVGSPFAARIDFDEARRLGLPRVPATEAVGNVLPVLRARLRAIGLVPTATRADATGRIDFVAPAGRSPEELARAQALLFTRGGLDVRAIVRPPGSAGGGRVYDGATPWPELLANERQAADGAAAVGVVRRAADVRWSVVLTGPGSEPVVLEEPRVPADAIDERLVASAEGLLAKDGSPAVRIEVRLDRRDDVVRFLRRHAGGEVAVLVDGVLRGRQPVPATDGASLVLTPGPAPKGREPLEWARDHAVLWSTGRMPWPLVAVPLAPEQRAEPPPENAFSRLAVAIGPPAAPMLRRLAADGPAWSRASAAWALARVGEEPPPR